MAGIYPIQSYQVYTVGTGGTIGENDVGFTYFFHTRITCTNTTTRDCLVIAVVPDERPLFAPISVNYTSSGPTIGYLSIRRSDMDALLDILRSGGASMYIRPPPGTWTCIVSTTPSPTPRSARAKRRITFELPIGEAIRPGIAAKRTRRRR